MQANGWITWYSWYLCKSLLKISLYGKRKKEYPQTTAFTQQSSLIIILIAFATYVAGFATPVACLIGWIGAVTSNVPRLVAIVAGWPRCCWLWAFSGNMACLVAIVAWWITGALLTIPGDVSSFVAAVAPILVFLTFTCKVTKAVTFVAFLLASTAFISSSTTRSSFWALSSKVTSAIAPVAHTRTHLDVLETKIPTQPHYKYVLHSYLLIKFTQSWVSKPLCWL